jgi:hypothetical protein
VRVIGERNELEQPEGDATQHAKAFTSVPGALHRLKMIVMRGFEGGILFRFARLALNIARPEAIGKGAQEPFEHSKHGFDTNASAIECDGDRWLETQIVAHEDDRATRGYGKDKAKWGFKRLPHQIQSEIGNRFFVAIDLTHGINELCPMGLKNLVELDFVALFARSPGSRRSWSLGDEIGAIIFLGSRDDIEARLLELDGPVTVGKFKDVGAGKERLEDQESLRAMALNEG